MASLNNRQTEDRVRKCSIIEEGGGGIYANWDLRGPGGPPTPRTSDIMQTGTLGDPLPPPPSTFDKPDFFLDQHSV